MTGTPLPPMRYYRLTADITFRGTVYFEAGSCVPENWVDANGLPRAFMVEISEAEGRAWFKADEERARRARQEAAKRRRSFRNPE